LFDLDVINPLANLILSLNQTGHLTMFLRRLAVDISHTLDKKRTAPLLFEEENWQVVKIKKLAFIMVSSENESRYI